jgi:predicted nucleotidyltransferase
MIEAAQRLEAICRKHGIAALWLFGSRAQEISDLLQGGPSVTTATGADLDVGVLPRRGRMDSPHDRVRFMAALEDLVGVGRVDLVVLPEARAFLALEVVKGHLVVDLDRDATAEFELYVLRRAGDLIEFERERRRSIIEQGAS